MKYSAQLLDLSHNFLSLSAKLPDNSKDLDTILENIDNLETYQDRKKYAEKNLKHISSGSSRIVYLTKDKTIIKIAKNDKGIAQNKAESNKNMKSKFLNKIIKVSKKYNWIEVPYLEKITAKKFKEMTQLDFNDFGNAIRYGLQDVSGNDKDKPKNFESVTKSDIYKELKRLGEKFKLMPGDLAKISSWGSKDNSPVLIDAGLTKKVFEDYYESDS